MCPSETNASHPTSKVSSDEEAKLKVERSRVYRRRYKKRQKTNGKMLQSQIEATEMEIKKLRLEQAELITRSHALYSLTTYSNSMIESLTAAASASVAKARSLALQVIEGGNNIADWSKDLPLTIPTVSDLIAGSVFTPSDNQVRWYLKTLRKEEIFDRSNAFVDRLTPLVEEGTRSYLAQQFAELRINHIVPILRRVYTLMRLEHPQHIEDVVCTYYLQYLKDQAAGKYVRPKILQNGSSELVKSVALTPEQTNKMEEHWEEFVEEIREARSILGGSATKASNGIDAAFEKGEYKPISSVDAAGCYLSAMDTANASDDFLLKECRALIKLFYHALHVLNPMQFALLLTSCRPLMVHIPDMYSLLLDGCDYRNQPAMGKSTESQESLIAHQHVQNVH